MMEKKGDSPHKFMQDSSMTFGKYDISLSMRSQGTSPDINDGGKGESPHKSAQDSFTCSLITVSKVPDSSPSTTWASPLCNKARVMTEHIVNAITKGEISK